MNRISLRQLTKRLLCLLFPLIAIHLHAQQKIAKWSVYEVTLTGPATGNPFVDTWLNAEFRLGDQVFHPDGFYDGNGMYKIRFMPNKEGTWTYTTSSNQDALNNQTGEFICTGADPKIHGPVRVRNQFHFAYADGTSFYPFGTTIYEWAFKNAESRKNTIQTLSASPFNKVRMLAIAPYSATYIQGVDKLNTFPFVGTSKENFDFTRFNPAYFKSLEEDIRRLGDIGLEADFILFRPYDKGKWGFDMMSDSTNILYLKYMVARFAAYHNIWWSMCNENSFIKHLTDADWDRYFQVVQKADPYNHLRSIHNADRIYDYTKPWVTHVSLQYYNVVKSPWGTSLLRDIYKKPIVNDEINYEGNISKRWGQLSGQEMTFRFWNAYIGCGYATHGEALTGGWISGGGKLSGESPERIAFLKKIIETGPSEGMEPIDHFYTPNIAGKYGEYYLIYFGKDAPEKWTFSLPKGELTEGMKFKAEVIDTWNMTITPIPQVFEIKKADDYTFTDKQSAAIPLPGKPYMAIRIRLVPDGAPKEKTKTNAKGEELQ